MKLNIFMMGIMIIVVFYVLLPPTARADDFKPTLRVICQSVEDHVDIFDVESVHYTSSDSISFLTKDGKGHTRSMSRCEVDQL